MLEVVKVDESEKAVCVMYDGERGWFGKSIIKAGCIPQWAARQKFGVDEALKIVESANGSDSPCIDMGDPADELEPEPEPVEDGPTEVEDVNDNEDVQEDVAEEVNVSDNNNESVDENVNIENKSDKPDWIVEHLHAKPEIKVTVTRGQRGTYGWEVSVYGNDKDDVIKRVTEIDEELRRIYTEGE